MMTDRRSVLGAGVRIATAMACGAVAVKQMSAREHLDGLIADDAIRSAAASDFGRLVSKQPRAVFRPASAGDIASLMRWAAGSEVKVAARGQGHSIYGRAMAEDGVVIDMTAMNSVHGVQDHRVTVDAGATWERLFEETIANGLTPPVLTNYLGLSIGGTLAVGGIGATSARYGMQTDQVTELEVVTGEGHRMICSETSNPELFDATRAGLGQCGVITRATLRLMRAPDRVRRYQLFYPGLSSMTADMQRALREERFDQLQGAVIPDGSVGWRYLIEAAVHYDDKAAPDDKAVLSEFSDERNAVVVTDLAFHKDATAFAKLESMLRANGQWFNPKPWLLAFLPASNAERFARELLGGLTAADVGPFGRVTFYPMHTRAVRTPLVRLPDGDVVFVLNVIRMPTVSDGGTMARLIADNATLYHRIRDLGGTQYPVSALPMSRDDWRAHFGPRWRVFQGVRKRHDPKNLLTPGYV